MEPRTAAPRSCALDDPAVARVLSRLHGEASGQRLGIARMGMQILLDRVLGRQPSTAEQSERAKNLHLPLGPKQGLFAYAMVRALSARRVVEFGTSVGVSTVYLAAGVRDNGGGMVIGSELEPGKVRTARTNLAEAGLGDVVEIREGDALETLRDAGGPVDLLLLDGWKELYLPVLQRVAPQLRPGALVLADNVFTFWFDLQPYLAWTGDPANGFRSLTLALGDGMACAVRV